jgi:uncharacterized membrane protein YbaN (DUF454 family)
MNQVKKSVITIVGVLFISIGVIFIMLPGPAVIFIPAGLAILSLEYPIARKWLRQAQRYMRKGAEKMDAMIRRR